MSASAVASACAGSAGPTDPRRSFAGSRGLELRGFEEHRKRVEPPIVQQPAERLQPKTAFPDVLVPIHTAAAGPLRVVQMKHPHPVEARRGDRALRTSTRSPVPSRYRSRPPTDGTYPGRRRHAEILGDTPGSTGDARTGVRGSFPVRRCVRAESSSSRGGALEADRQSPGNQLEALCLAARRVGPRMHHEPLKAERVRAIQLGAERVDRLRAQSGRAAARLIR